MVALQRTLLEKAMRFDVLARIETLATVVGGVAGIAIALAGGGVWALVLQTLTTVAAMALLLWMHSVNRVRGKVGGYPVPDSVDT
jgi:O-antigen/teichoic acid export membrane protein